MKKLSNFVLLLCIALTFSVNAQTVDDQKDKFSAIYAQQKAIVESQNYQFNGEWVYSDRNREQISENTSVLKIKKTTVEGEIHALSSNRKVVLLNDNISNYKVSYNDNKQAISISFSVLNYKIDMEIRPNGNAFLKLSGSGTVITQVGKLSEN